MVQCMESWFLSEPEKLATYFGQGFRKNALPRNTRIEEVSKRDVSAALERATKGTMKGKYHKTRHGFAILASIEPDQIRQRSPHANALFDVLTEKLAP